MAKNDKREAAKTLAATGASAQKISRQTGVSSAAATKMAAKAAPTNNMKINYQDVINNPGKYDAGYSQEVASQNPDSVIYKGLYGGGLNAGGTNDFYKLQGYQVPGATNGIGPDGSVLFMADPGNGRGQEWLNENFGPGGRYYGGDKGGSAAATAATPGTATGSSDAQTATAQQAAISKKNSLSKNLKIAQAGGITRNELADLSKGIDSGKVVRRMDAMNKKGKDLRLNSGAANMLLKQAGPASGGFYGLNIKPMFGTGNIGRALEGMRGTRPSGGYTNPQSGYSMKTPGTEPSFMMGGTQIRKGGRTAVRKQGAQTAAPATTNTTNTTTTTNTPSTIPGPIGAATDGPLDQLQKDYAAMGPGGLYGGGLGGPGASRLRRARSRQQQLGIRGAGTSINNRTSPFFNSLNR